ncbi:cell wall metabolism sensor histidine kinase WalK [Aliikangiella sp. G2MR2-5]|uniref:sensor histidine kinase n=1 Tax=Aliikangiella sp. G2MR2-5 TaxID=2788943 RepID=UPI0018ABCF7A|nr:ATP-binding protein [Aliikangiella sp. G2MR2-5]
MSYFFRIFVLFAVSNYALLFFYDNYYLVSIENEFVTSSRDQLRKLTLGLRAELSKSEDNQEAVINEFAMQNNIPSQIMLQSELTIPNELAEELLQDDYIIDIYSSVGPISYLNISKGKVVEIGPLDPFYMDSTSYQPLFIFLSILCNLVIAAISYRALLKSVRKLEVAVENVQEREHVSAEFVGEQGLLRRVAAKILALDRYIQEIEETNMQVIDDQRDLMHAVAHELRSPIARMSFALELVEEEDASPENRKLLKEMHDSIDELESLIREILGYSRLSHGKMTLNLEATNLSALITALTARLQSLYPHESFEVDCQLENNSIMVDPRLLERAVVNLLRNAARFAKSRVRVSLYSQESKVCIAIDDDGVGVPPGKRNRIFEAFTRLDPSRSRDSGGVGLGLAIVKKIVEKHFGEVEVDDSLLGGARFVITLPATQPTE